MTYLLLGKVGDLLSVLPFLKAEADAGEKPTLVVSNQFADLLDGVSYVTVVPFEGGVELLKEGFEFAKSKFPGVKSLQVVGERNIVGEVTYRPAGQECARTTSFVKEMWKLAGKMPLWDSVLPLVFDRRDKAREKALLSTVLPIKRGRHAAEPDKILLVATGGKSSPFPYSELLWTLLRLNFTKGWRIVDLANVRAERFYDLLALYEQAHCLVATDSAPLHLARAVPSLPVMALTNDRPLLWNGSAWMPNWHWVCRYHDFPERAVGLLNAIETCRNQSPIPFIRVWNNYDLSEPPKDYSRNYLPVWPGACGRDTANTIKDPKRLPYLKDCLRMGLQRATDNEQVCLTRNGTAITSPELPKYDAMFAYRLSEAGFAPIADLFCAKKSWWKERLAEIPDFLLGRDHYWSEGLRVMFDKYGTKDVTGLCYREAKKL